MMEENLYLEPDEEITSVIDKLKRSRGPRVNLVIPRQATILQSVVNLKLLAKEAANLGREIAVITGDKIGRNLAAKVGIPVFDSEKNPEPVFEPPPPEISTDEVIEIDMRQPKTEQSSPKGLNVHHFQTSKNSEWREEYVTTNIPEANSSFKSSQKLKFQYQINWKKLGKFVIPALIIILLAIFGLAYYFLPKVHLQLKVEAEDFNQNTQVEVAGESINDPEYFIGKMMDLSQEKEESFPATGKKNLGQRASGTLTLYNGKGSPQSFTAGTKLSSSSKTFLLKSAVTISGASINDNGEKVIGTSSAEIIAENPGEDYNIPAGTFQFVTLPSNDQRLIYGQSSKPMAGGLTKEVSVISQSDFDQAKEKISKQLSDTLVSEAKDQTAGMLLIEQAVKIDQTVVESSAKVNDEASNFSLKLKDRLRIIMVDKNSFDKFVIDKLEKEISADKMISLGEGDKISPSVKELKYEQNKMTLNVEVAAKMSTRVDITKIKSELAGKTKSQVQSYLSGLEGIEGTEIEFQPAWWLKRIPKYKNSFNVSLEYIEK